MLQFVYPWWLLALPFSVLPWFWPVIRSVLQRPIFFSTFFLFPKESHRPQFRFSWKHPLLKILRSLIILLFCILLARPFWISTETPTVIRLDDDTPSTQWFLKDRSDQYPAQSNAVLPQKTFTLSDLFPTSKQRPLASNYQWPSLSPHTPSLSQIGEALLQSPKFSSNQRYLQIHLFSDFQWSQYRFYPTAIQNIEWVFHRSDSFPPTNNIALHQFSISTTGRLESLFSAEVYGRTSAQQIKILVHQSKKIIGTKIIELKTLPRKIQIDLGYQYNRTQPIEVQLESQNEDPSFDNIRFYQKSRLDKSWIAILTSEGTTGVYRHGLHQLKSALNANHVVSFLVTQLEELQRTQPDLILLLGDFPIRWAEPLKNETLSVPGKLFIPTRLGDWKAFATQIPLTENQTTPISTFPPNQWKIDWSKVDFAQEWKIRQKSDMLYYSEKWDMWLLATGISPSWGALYKDISFADQVQTWIEQIYNSYQIQLLGTFETGMPLPLSIPLPPNHLVPGHYVIQAPNQNKTFHFSINLPAKESIPDLFSKDDLHIMQNHFDEKHHQYQQQQGEGVSNQLRNALLWGLLSLLGIELLVAYRHLIQPKEDAGM